MRTIFIAVIMSLAAGCVEAKEPDAKVGDMGIYVWVDQQRGVTCYVVDGYKSSAIQCFTEKELKK